MSDRKKGSHKKFVTRRSSLKLGRAEQQHEQPVILRRKSQINRPEVQIRNQGRPVPRFRAASSSSAVPAGLLSPRGASDETGSKQIGGRVHLAKRKLHRQVEVEAYTYGFDVAYADYLGRYNKTWAVIEILDSLQAYQLLRGVIRHADRIGNCVIAFIKTMRLLVDSKQVEVFKLMKRRLNSMIYMVKSVIIQTKTIQEVLVSIGAVSDEEYRSAFQTQVNKMHEVRANLEEVCQKATSSSISTKVTEEEVSSSPLMAPPARRKYNNPMTQTSVSMPTTTPRDRDVHEEHAEDLELSTDSAELCTSSDSE